jgi:prophage antirepressor-like protein
MSQNKLAKLRNTDVFKALMRVLDEYRIPKEDFRVLDKRPHPMLTVRYCGVEREMSIPSTPKTRGKAPVAYSAQLRRLLKEMQMASLGGSFEQETKSHEVTKMQDQSTLPLFAGVQKTPTDSTNFVFEGMAVRVIVKDGEPWFVLADACRILEYSDSAQAARILDGDEVDTLHNMQGMTESRNGIVKIVSESGLFSLILRSRKREAKEFKKWVTRDVLPQIRKTGTYGHRPITVDDLLANPGQLLVLAQGYALQIEDLKRDKEVMQKDVDALDRIAKSDGSLCITDAAKNLQVQPQRLFKWLDTNGWTYIRPGTSTRLAYQTKMNAGYLEHKVSTKPREDGSERVFTQVRITPKGLAHLAEIFPPIAKAV